MITWSKITSPIGELRLVSNGRALTAIEFAGQHGREGAEGSDRILQAAARQLDEYFRGDRQQFDIALGAQGTEFQQRVWQALTNIPYGETCTYGDIARDLDKPKAVRAVGAANGKNPIPIIVPCHRVIGSTGKLTGFSGGLETKRQLLALEAASPG